MIYAHTITNADIERLENEGFEHVEAWYGALRLDDGFLPCIIIEGRQREVYPKPLSEGEALLTAYAYARDLCDQHGGEYIVHLLRCESFPEIQANWEKFWR